MAEELWITVPRDLEQEEAIISPHARMKTFKIRPRDGEVKPSNHILRE